MNREAEVKRLTELADSVMLAKGKDYTAGNWDTDPNYNFNEIARLLQGAPINPYTVCMIYFLKHVFSLIKFCKTGKQEGGEGLEGRHVDALNYVRILWTLVVESKMRDEKEEHYMGYDQEGDEDDSEVCRITGMDPRDLAQAINYEYAGCTCPTCKRCFERDSQAAQDWLDRVNEIIDKNKQTN